MENCTRYDCVETAVGAMVLASGVVCPPFNDTECLQVCVSEINDTFKVLPKSSLEDQKLYR